MRFSGCHSLGVIIPQNLVSIGRYAFYKCWLDSITIPKKLTNIDKCAFKGCHYNCENLEIIVDESNPKYDSRENCNAIIETKSNTLFIGCDTTKIPNSVKFIGEGAFQDCYLTSFVLPKSMEYIGKRAFDGCTNMTYITILGNPTIMDEAFKKSNSFRDLYCYSEEIHEVHNAFEGLDISLITLHVPTDVFENYRNIEPWCKFGSIVSFK